MNFHIEAVSYLLEDAKLVAATRRQDWVDAMDRQESEQAIAVFYEIWQKQEAIVQALLERLVQLREDAIEIPQFGESATDNPTPENDAI